MSDEEGISSTRDFFTRLTERTVQPLDFSPLDRAHLRAVGERETAIAIAIHEHLDIPLSKAQILEVGCGHGISLAALASFGAHADNLYGVDLVAARVEEARARLPGAHLTVSSADSVEFADDAIDVVLQVTSFCVIHPAAVRQAVAAEMRRVLRKGGLVVSFDVSKVSRSARAFNRSLRFLRRDRGQVPRRLDIPEYPSNFEPTAADLRDLFPAFVELSTKRLALYKPLAERFVDARTRLRLLEALPAFDSALLWVARKPY